MVKTQGRRGEVAAELHTDFPEKFAQRKQLLAQTPDGSRPLQVEEYWPHPKGWMILKFAGVDSIDQAEKLIGSELQIPKQERAVLESGAAWVSDLVGCRVSAKSPPDTQQVRDLGVVADVQFGAGEAPLLIVREGAKEYLLPFVEGFVEELDCEGKKLSLKLPQGMLELDAPLTPEERDLQARGDPGKRQI